MRWPTLVGAAKRPMLWLGGGARDARAAGDASWSERGFGVVTSTQGRARRAGRRIRRTLGAFNMTPEARRSTTAPI